MIIKQGFAAEERAMLRGTKIDAQELTSFVNWYPVAISADEQELWWRNMHDQAFTEAFFQDSLAIQDRDKRQVCNTPLHALHSIVAGLDCVRPTAFIFHVSRCGSTLLTQMLSKLERCIVLSEPPVLDAFFRFYHDNPDIPDAHALFRQLVFTLGQRRSQAARKEEHFFIKFDSWHLPWLDFIREAFPDVRFIFLYREPQAVLASHRRQRGPQMIPGVINTTRLQADFADCALADHDAYTAAMLLAMFRAGFEHGKLNGVNLVNYSQLPLVLWQQLLPMVGVHFKESELRLMEQRSARHSKNRHQLYTGDAFTDTQSSETCELLMSQVSAAYELLELQRLVEGR